MELDDERVIDVEEPNARSVGAQRVSDHEKANLR